MSRSRPKPPTIGATQVPDLFLADLEETDPGTAAGRHRVEEA
jgi:hypothetical protein